MEKFLKSGWCVMFRVCFKSLLFVCILSCSLVFGMGDEMKMNQSSVLNDQGILREGSDANDTEQLIDELLGNHTSFFNHSAQNDTYEVTELTIGNEIDTFLQKKKQENEIGWRDLSGFLSGITTGGLVKIAVGISAIISSIVILSSQTYAVCTNSPTYDIKPDINVSFISSIGEILDFSNQKNVTYVEKDTTYWCIRVNHLCQKELTNTQVAGCCFSIFVGVLTVVSGFIDFYSSYTIPGSFKKITIKGYNLRKQNNKSIIKNEDLDKFLSYAYGEFMDLYQKRGSFNRDKYFSVLLKW